MQDLHPAKNLSHRAALREGMERHPGDSLKQGMEGPACQAELLPRKDCCLLGSQSLDIVERRLRFIQALDGSPKAREDTRHVNCDQLGGGGVEQGSWGLNLPPCP